MVIDINVWYKTNDEYNYFKRRVPDRKKTTKKQN